MIENITIGERIRFLRERKNLNQKELGKLIGKSHNMITYYEKNKTPLSKEVVVALAKYLDTTPEYILEGEEKLLIASEPESVFVKTDIQSKYMECLEENMRLNKEIERLKNAGSKPVYS